MGAPSGSFGQPNYQPTQGTGQNPSVSIGFGMEPPDFQEGFQTTDVNGNPLTTQQQQFVGGLGNAMTGVGRGLGQAFGVGGQPQPGGFQMGTTDVNGVPLTTQQQQFVGGLGNAMTGALTGIGSAFGGGKSGPVTGGPLPLPGQNPSVSIGMPVQGPGFRPDTRGPGGFGNDYYGNPIGVNGLPLQMTMATPRPAQAGAPMQQPANRFIPPMAPGASARRGIPLPGLAPQQQIQFGGAGQLGSARANLLAGQAPFSNAVASRMPARPAVQQSINRVTRGRFR